MAAVVSKVKKKATQKSNRRSAARPASGKLLRRDKVATQDTWDLASLYASDAAWETAFDAWAARIPGYEKFAGKLGESVETLAECLTFDAAMDRESERLGNYAFLKTAEDGGESKYQRMAGRYRTTSSKAGQAASFIRPELLAVEPARMDAFSADPKLAPWKLALERILRHRPHTLAKGEERLLAMQTDMASAARSVFGQLTDIDFTFGKIKDEKGRTQPLTHSSFSAFLHSHSRPVRKAAFETYYATYESHKNALAASLNGSAQADVYYARARNFSSAREASLFQDNVPVAVYDNLIAAVHKHLPLVHRYLDLRQKTLKLKSLHMYDTYAPLVSSVKTFYPWDKAVEVVVESLAPLGKEYVSVLGEGMTTGRWCDRYENVGKRSGAFSSGAYDGKPYILMNYQPSVIDHVFTLAHEAGHSMHTWYSTHNQPYQYHNYTIFVAEVASTFNEQLLARHLLDRAQSVAERAYLINRIIDGIRGTIIRQTMFAEFEKVSHEIVESGEPLTVEKCRSEYRRLLEKYFGKKFTIDPQLELECLRIPHFYNAFYVYKYATGLSAAIALSQRVLNGGHKELGDYLNFLRGGCSKFPLDLLRDAGVDMEKALPVNTALDYFGTLLNELEELL